MLILNHEQTRLIPERISYSSWISHIFILIGQQLFLIGIAFSLLLCCLTKNNSRFKEDIFVYFLPYWIFSGLAILSPFLSYHLSKGYIELCLIDPSVQTSRGNQPPLITSVIPNLAVSFVNAIVYLVFLLFSISAYLSLIIPIWVWPVLTLLFSLFGFVTVLLFGVLFKYKKSHEFQALGAAGITMIISFALELNQAISNLFLYFSFLSLILYISAISTVIFFRSRYIMYKAELLLSLLELITLYSLAGNCIHFYFTTNDQVTNISLHEAFGIHFFISIVLLTFIRMTLLLSEIRNDTLSHRQDIITCRKFRQFSLTPGIHHEISSETISSINPPNSSNLYTRASELYNKFFEIIKSKYTSTIRRIMRHNRFFVRSVNTTELEDSYPTLLEGNLAHH